MASASSASSSITSTRIAVPLLAWSGAWRPLHHASPADTSSSPAAPSPRAGGGRPAGKTQGWLPPNGGRPPDGSWRAGSWIAVAVALPPFSVIWAETTSPTLTEAMPVTLPVTLVELVTAAVIVLMPPAIVIEVLLTAVTLPRISSCPTWPPLPGTPPLPGKPPLLGTPPCCEPPGDCAADGEAEAPRATSAATPPPTASATTATAATAS